MIKAALIGRDIGYTRSPAVHAAIAEALGIELKFEVRDIAYDMLESTVKELTKTCDAFFVTKPYKNDVRELVASVDTRCGVNFVTCKDGVGHNTDGKGFIRALDRAFEGWRGDVDAALVLGAGGAAYAVTEALINAGKKVYVLNRTIVNAAKLCKSLGAEIFLNQPVQMAINCTSLGLHNEDVLYKLCVLPEFKYAYDLIYTPAVTPFLQRCEGAGARTANGADMLVFQAIEGDAMLLDKKIDVMSVFEKVNKILGN